MPELQRNGGALMWQCSVCSGWFGFRWMFILRSFVCDVCKATRT
ncbi:hypothetical protein [Streptomyces sp. NPDC048516]